MKRGLNIGLIIGGSLAGAGLLAWGIKKLIDTKNERGEQEAFEDAKKELAKLVSRAQVESGDIQNEAPDCSSPNRFVPTRDIDKNITNSFSDMMNRSVRPAKRSTNPETGHTYASGYAWLRSSPEVNNPQGLFIDGNYHNRIMKVTGGLGKVVGESYDNQDPKMRWFKVKYSGSKTGWVRSDNVTFTGYDNGYSTECHTYFHCIGKQDPNISATLKNTLNDQKKNDWNGYKKVCKSVGVSRGSIGFDGSNMVEHYDNSYQLGAQVFPHSNWQENNYIEGNRTQFENDILTDI